MSKGFVECVVQCIVMLGIVIDEVLLEECCDNIFVVVCGYSMYYGLVMLDVISGCFVVFECDSDESLLVEIQCINLVELFYFEGFESLFFVENCKGLCRCFEWEFDVDIVNEQFNVQFEIKILDGFGIKGVIKGLGVVGCVL